MSQAAKTWLRVIILSRTFSAIVASVFVFISMFMAVSLRDSSKAQAAGTWLSGASGKAITDGSFGAWRGAPLSIAATWVDNDSAAAAMAGPCSEYGNWTGSLDLAVGGFDNGGSWSQAASGAYDSKWTAAMQKLYSCWGQKKTIFIRPFHEFNSGYPWGVKSASDANNFKLAFARYSNIIKTQLKDKGKDARVEICPNNDTLFGYGINAVWPGDQYVDVVGVDYYDGYPPIRSDGAWGTGNANDPKFPPDYLAFAKSHGKPLSFPEWGIRKDQGGDNPFYIQKMYDFFSAHAGTGTGQVIHEVFYNDDYLGPNFIIYPNSSGATNAAAKYKSLKWPTGGSAGNGGGTTTPAPSAAVTPNPSGTNVLAGKPIASSVGDNADEPGNGPANANDGNEATRWISAAANGVTLTVDMGTSYKLTKTQIIWAGDTTKNYDLQVSGDGTTWTTVKSGTTTNQAKETVDIALSNVSGRYLRVVAKDRWSDSFGNSIYELAAYGTVGSGGANPCASLKIPKADINGDCKVNITDLSLLLSSWAP